MQLLKLPLPSSKLNQGHLSGVKCVHVSDDATIIVSGGYDRAVCVWDMQTGKMLNRIGGMMLVVQQRSNEERVVKQSGHDAGGAVAGGSKEMLTALFYYLRFSVLLCCVYYLLFALWV